MTNGDKFQIYIDDLIETASGAFSSQDRELLEKALEQSAIYTHLQLIEHENEQLKLKIKFITKYNAKLAGIDIEKIDAHELKSLIGESYTNADKIRSMNDEELNQKLIDVWHSGYKHAKLKLYGNIEVSYMEWLKSEAK